MGTYICYENHIHIANQTYTDGALSYLGYADITEQIVSDMVSTADAATIDSMSDEIEVTNDAWATIVRDARDNIDEILSKPRIDRRALARIRDDLNAEL